jgi:hypothetical protein
MELTPEKVLVTSPPVPKDVSRAPLVVKRASKSSFEVVPLANPAWTTSSLPLAVPA